MQVKPCLYSLYVHSEVKCLRGQASTATVMRSTSSARLLCAVQCVLVS